MTTATPESSVLHCPYVGCPWELHLAPGQAIAEELTDNLCRRHLDGVHPGWTVEETQRQLAERARQCSS